MRFGWSVPPGSFHPSLWASLAVPTIDPHHVVLMAFAAQQGMQPAVPVCTGKSLRRNAAAGDSAATAKA
jgi:hypothetical protein